MQAIPTTYDPMQSSPTPQPLLAWSSNERDFAMEAEDASLATKSRMSAMASFIRDRFDEAERHRQEVGIDDEILRCKKQRAGLYDADKLAAIEQMNGSKVFLRLTETKCGAAEGLLKDVFQSFREKPWRLRATPIPSLPDHMVQEFVVDQVIREALEEYPELGMDPSLVTPEVSEVIAQNSRQLHDEVLAEVRHEAERRVQRMEQLIDDQMHEGGFYSALEEFFSFHSTYPLGILKGPVSESRKKVSWVGGGPTVTEEAQPVFKVVEPEHFYPSPYAKRIEDADICEVCYYEPDDLEAMKGLEFWDVDAIDRLLREYPSSGMPPANISFSYLESDMADLNKVEPVSYGLYAGKPLRAVHYWGKMHRSHLEEFFGDPAAVPGGKFYFDVHAILCGDEIVYARLNPDPLGRHPYHVAPFEKTPGSLWGVSLPAKIRDCQDGANAFARAAINNAALSSGFQVIIDYDAMMPGQDKTSIYPNKAWLFKSSRMSANGAREPVKFFQPDLMTERLHEGAEFWMVQADERSMIPRYTHGDQQASGAATTASGLQMLLNSQGKAVKRMVSFIDEGIIRPIVQQLYTYNMLFHEDDKLKGDAQVVPIGAIELLTREQTDGVALDVFERLTANEVASTLIGLEGFHPLLKMALRPFGDGARILPPVEDAMRALQAQQAMGQDPNAPEDAGGEDDEEEGDDAGQPE